MFMYLFCHVRRDDVSTFAKGHFDVCTYTVFLGGEVAKGHFEVCTCTVFLEGDAR